MSDIRIDSHKLLFHPESVTGWVQARGQWEKIQKLYPIYVEISPTGACNLRCTFCAMDFLKYKNNRIEWPILKKCLGEMREKGVKSVLFAGEGEPLLYEELDEALRFCSSIGLDSALSTNGSIANRKALRSAVVNCSWIKFSINAGTQQVHGAMHRCREDIFERIFENIDYCVSLRKSRASQCVIGAQAVLVDENRDSMVELARRCRKSGIDYLVIKPYSQHPESITKIHATVDYGDLHEFFQRLSDEEVNGFRIHLRPDSFRRAKTSSSTYGHCLSVPVFWAYLRSNGDVYGCSSFLLDQRFCYGNINEQEFVEIWEGERRKAGFEHLKHTHKIDECRTNCRMDKVNEYLWELEHPSPHVNFI